MTLPVIAPKWLRPKNKRICRRSVGYSTRFWKTYKEIYFSTLQIGKTQLLQKPHTMKKLACFTLIFATIIAMGSCTVDDSNDIEIIKPGDTVITGTIASEMPL